MQHHRVGEAIQKKTKSAINPKTISGKLKAKPIFNHCENERPSRLAVSDATSGSDSWSSTSPVACNRLRCWVNSALALSTVLSARLNSLCKSVGFQLFGSIA